MHFKTKGSNYVLLQLLKGTSFLKNVLRDQNENFMDFVFKFFVDFIPSLENNCCE